MALAEVSSEEGDGAFWEFKWSLLAGAALRGERLEEDGAEPWRTLSEAGFVLEQATGTQGAVEGAHPIDARSLDAFLKPPSTWLLSYVRNEVRHQSLTLTRSAPAEVQASLPHPLLALC